jgi:hypothetical protein
MLIEVGRTIALLHFWPDDHPFDLSASMCAVRTFIEQYDQDPVSAGLKKVAVEQRPYVGIQPGVGDAQSTVMRVVAKVRNDKGQSRERVLSQICRELRKRNDVFLIS